MFGTYKRKSAAHARVKAFAATLPPKRTVVRKGKGKKRALLRHLPPPAAPPAAPLPEPPARSSLSPPSSRRGAPGALRVHPCLGCVRSALAGRSSGECFDQSGGVFLSCCKGPG
ncbi:hypothetical protein EJ02DRAFT_511604 [Clathrospora elynae]|uniref:Uncharacterized protein n=1 Tax=Clathrospora elynae TaxID=706981 RepID=A0A6A5SSF4_9PLEO|nr:hypothetical protein EJ02DRAFT_511604 [Clathrospora elynae]